MFAAAGMAFVGCSKEDISEATPELSGNKITVNALAIAPAETRVEIDGLKVNWSDEETFKVVEISYEGDEFKKANPYNILEGSYAKSDDGKATFQFGVNEQEGDSFTYYAISPYPTDGQQDKGYIHAFIPKEQTYGDSVDPSAVVLMGTSQTYNTQAADGETIEFDFEHLTGYAKMTLKNLDIEETIGSISFTAEESSSNKNYIAGLWQARLDEKANQFGSSNSNSNEITVKDVNIEASNTADGVVVWFGVAPVENISSFTIKVFDTKNEMLTKKTVTINDKKPLAFKAGQISIFSVDMTPAGEVESATYGRVTKLEDITDGEYIFVSEYNEDYYTLTNNPGIEELTKTGLIYSTSDYSITGDATGHSWTLTTSGNENSFYITKPNTSSYLMITGTGATNLGLATADPKDWKMSVSSTVYGCFNITSTNTNDATRYLSTYNGGSWRVYAAIDNNGNGGNSQVILFKKDHTSDYDPNTQPEEPEEPEEPGKSLSDIYSENFTGECTVTNALVVATNNQGYVIKEGENFMQVYLGSNATTPDIGDKGTVTGIVENRGTNYGNYLQFKSGTKFEKTGSESVDHGSPAQYGYTELAAYAAKTGADLQPIYVTYTGVLSINNSNYNIVFNNKDDHMGSISYPSSDMVAGFANGDVVIVTGYLVGFASNGKYINTCATSVVKDTTTPNISVSPTSLSFTAEGGDQTATLTLTNQGSLNVETEITGDAAQAFSAQVSGTTLTVTAQANDGDNRNATLTLKLGTATATVKLTQTGKVTGNVKTIEIDLTTNVLNVPTSSNDASSKLADYTYDEYSLKGKNIYCNNSYLMFKKSGKANTLTADSGALGLPAISGYKLTTITASNNKNASASAQLGVYTDDSGSSQVSGGDSKKWASTDSICDITFDLADTKENTMYYLIVDVNYNVQVTKLVLTYVEAN